ncbi:MAG: lysylphosphatidylglycerol synthase transmembrane domain-containing protein [Candidatus Micrarchaeota archaeon]
MLKTILAIAGALMFLLLIWYSGPAAVWNAVTQANPLLFAAALACLLLLTALKGLRLHALLQHAGRLKRREALAVFSFGQLTNQGITTLLGEVAKGALLKKIHGFSFSNSMGVILVERGYDFLFTVFFAAIALASLRPDWLPFLALLLAVAFFGVAAAAFAPSKWFSFLKRWKKLWESAAKFRHGIVGLRPQALCLAFAFSAVAWLFEGLGNHFIFSALGIQLPLLTVLGITSAGLIVGFATMIPGGIGSREATMVLLYSAADISAPAVIAQALLYRIGMTAVSLAAYVAAGKK